MMALALTSSSRASSLMRTSFTTGSGSGLPLSPLYCFESADSAAFRCPEDSANEIAVRVRYSAYLSRAMVIVRSKRTGSKLLAALINSSELRRLRKDCVLWIAFLSQQIDQRSTQSAHVLLHI